LQFRKALQPWTQLSYPPPPFSKTRLFPLQPLLNSSFFFPRVLAKALPYITSSAPEKAFFSFFFFLSLIKFLFLFLSKGGGTFPLFLVNRTRIKGPFICREQKTFSPPFLQTLLSFFRREAVFLFFPGTNRGLEGNPSSWRSQISLWLLEAASVPAANSSVDGWCSHPQPSFFLFFPRVLQDFFFWGGGPYIVPPFLDGPEKSRRQRGSFFFSPSFFFFPLFSTIPPFYSFFRRHAAEFSPSLSGQGKDSCNF